MKLSIRIGGDRHETVSSRDAGDLKRAGYISGGKGGVYDIADGVGGWPGICNALAKRRERERS